MDLGRIRVNADHPCRREARVNDRVPQGVSRVQPAPSCGRVFRMDLPGSPLTAGDLIHLAKSGISAELAEAALLRRVEPVEGSQLIGRNGKGDYAGIVFPYVWPGGDHIRELRLRRDPSGAGTEGGWNDKRTTKYVSPPGRGKSLVISVPGTDPHGSPTRRCP